MAKASVTLQAKETVLLVEGLRLIISLMKGTSNLPWAMEFTEDYESLLSKFELQLATFVSEG